MSLVTCQIHITVRSPFHHIQRPEDGHKVHVADCRGIGWEAGAMFGTMVDYWAYTGDETYVNETYQALQHQVGDDNDFMPTNQTRTEGNDEYVFVFIT